jgi:hypothetical protein
VAALLRAGVPDEAPTPPSRSDAAGLATGPAPRATVAGRPASGLVRAFDRLERLPPRPRRAGASSRSSRASRPLDVDAAAAAIDTDVGLTVAVLGSRTRHARPAARPPRSATRSKALDADGLREVLDRVGDIGVFERVPGWESTLEQFRLHGVATQQAAEQVVRTLGGEPSDELSVAALAARRRQARARDGARVLPERRAPAGATPEARVVAERRALGVDHAVAGGVMGRRWGLPEGVVRVIEYHHDRKATGDVAVVRLADMLAHHGHGRAIDSGELSAAASGLGLGGAPCGRSCTSCPRPPRRHARARPRR